MNLTEILVPISMFASMFGILYIFFTTRSKERLAMIEKGIDANIFIQNNKAKAKRWVLKTGMLGLGIGLGLMIYTFMDLIFQFEGHIDEALIPSFMLLFGGAAFVLNFFLERKMDLDEKDDEE
jgi:predicted MFS family arabinose efflux permease